MKKKDLPLNILKALQQFVNLKGEKFEVIEPKENLLKVIDKDLKSDFHFIIEKYQKDSKGNFQFLMNRSPKDSNENKSIQSWVDISGLSGQFDIWIKLLDGYENVNSFYDDPITNSYKEEFYAEFEIVEEDLPFKTKQILLLDEYLEIISNKLIGFTSEKNSDDIEQIQLDINVLRTNLTNKSKKWVVNKLTIIWAKIARQGTNFIKEFLSESKKELIKECVKGLVETIVEKGPDLLN